MQANITFNTLQYMDDLKRSGIPEAHAEALTNATQNALNQLIEVKSLATQNEIEELNHELKQIIEETKFELIKAISDSMWKTIGVISTFQGIILGIIGIVSYIK